jgi:hypothetical protein
VVSLKLLCCCSLESSGLHLYVLNCTSYCVHIKVLPMEESVRVSKIVLSLINYRWLSHCLPYFVAFTNLRMRWLGHIVCIGGKRNACRFWFGSLKLCKCLESLDIDWRMILLLFLKKLVVKVQTGYIWCSVGSIDGLLWTSNLGLTQNVGNFFDQLPKKHSAPWSEWVSELVS